MTLPFIHIPPSEWEDYVLIQFVSIHILSCVGEVNCMLNYNDIPLLKQLFYQTTSALQTGSRY